MTLPPTLRKVAILVSALDARSADALLDQMGAEQAARVRHAVMHLDDVSPAEQNEVISQFLRGGSPAAPEPETAADGGVELDLRLTQLPPPAAAPEPQPAAAPFEFLHEAEAEPLARLLAQEHPQTAAVVLAHLPSAQSAAVLRLFPQATQTDVLRRIAHLDDASPEILHELEAHLRAVLSPQLRTTRQRERGREAAHAILAAVAPAARQAMLAELAARDAALAGQLKSAPESSRASSQEPAAAHEPVSAAAQGGSVPALPTRRSSARGWQQLLQLEAAAWRTLWEAAEPSAFWLALVGVEERAARRLLAALPRGVQREILQQLRQPGPLRLREVEQAQQALVELAAHALAGQVPAHFASSWAAA